MDILTPLEDGTIAVQQVIQKYVCIFHNGESYVAWATSKADAAAEAESRGGYGKPWRVLVYR